MKAKFIVLMLACQDFFPSAHALQDLTGTYKCSGVDTKDGKFTGVDTMQLDKTNSTGKISGYAFKAPEFEGGLSGFATFDGKNLAIYFYSLDKALRMPKTIMGS